MLTVKYLPGILTALTAVSPAFAAAEPTTLVSVTTHSNSATAYTPHITHSADNRVSNVFSWSLGDTEPDGGRDSKDLSSVALKHDEASTETQDSEKLTHDYALVCGTDRALSFECVRWGYYCTGSGKLTQKPKLPWRDDCEEDCACININPKPKIFQDCVYTRSGQKYCLNIKDKDGGASNGTSDKAVTQVSGKADPAPSAR